MLLSCALPLVSRQEQCYKLSDAYTVIKLRTQWCAAAQHQVAIFDATNTTAERRNYLIDLFHGKVQYIFIESMCDDAATIQKNMELKLKYSPDYADMSHEKV